MSFSCGFFNSQNRDRVYTAENFTEYLSCLICDGILDTYGDCFSITADGGLSVTVGTGKAWIKGHYFTSDEPWTQNLSSFVSASLERYVLVGICCDMDSRDCYLLADTVSAPQDGSTPAFSNSETQTFLTLAAIHLPAGASVITAENIIDLRDDEEKCGYVKCILGKCGIDDTMLKGSINNRKLRALANGMELGDFFNGTGEYKDLIGLIAWGRNNTYTGAKRYSHMPNFALGKDNKINADAIPIANNILLGESNEIKNKGLCIGSLIVGVGNKATKLNGGAVIGSFNDASGAGMGDGYVIGASNSAFNIEHSLILGTSNHAGDSNSSQSTSYSVLCGYYNTVEAGATQAYGFGRQNRLSKQDTYVLGFENTVNAACSFVIGTGITVNESATVRIGFGSTALIIDGGGNLTLPYGSITAMGNITSTNGVISSSGADYAEYLRPWSDGNPNGEDRTGLFVTVRDGKLMKAAKGDYVCGVTSVKPSVIGGYTPEQATDPAWDYVGMLGALIVRDDGSCSEGGFCMCSGDGIATAVAEQGFNTFFVLERKTDDEIEILMR